MNITQFAINKIAFNHVITTGDTMTLTLTHVTENIPKTVTPVIVTIGSTFFTCEITSVVDESLQDLPAGDVYLKNSGYYNYQLKKNGNVIESSQVFVNPPEETVVVNNSQNTVTITTFGAGSSGSSGASGTNGISGTNGLSGTSGLTGSSGSSGQNGVAGTSGINGQTGASGTSGISGTSGQTGATGSSGSSGLTGTSGTSTPGVAGTSGVNGTSGINGVAGSSGSSGQNGSSGSSGMSGTSGSSGSSGANGISAGRTYYFNNSQNSDVSGYKVLAEEPTTTSTQTVTVSIPGNSSALMQQFITPQLGFNVIPSGVQRFYLYFTKPASNDSMDAYITLQLADATGTPVGSVITSQTEVIGWNAGNPSETVIEVVFATTNIDPTYRMIVKIYGNNNDANQKNLVFSTENGNYSFVVTSVGVSAATSGSSGTSGANGLPGSSGSSGANGQAGSSGSSGSNGLQGLSNWTPIYSNNITQSNSGTFIKTGATDAFDAGIRSLEGYPTVYIAGRPALPISTSRCYLGLNTDPAATNGWDDVDYLIGWSIGQIFIHENGVTVMEVSNVLGIFPTDTTEYRVTYDGINVRYYVDNTLVRTVARSLSAGLLYADATIYNGGGLYGWKNLVFGPYGQIGASGTSGVSGSSGTSAGGGNVSAYSVFATGIAANTGLDGPYTFFTNITITYPVWGEVGQKLTSINYNVKTNAFTNGAFEIALYNIQPANTSMAPSYLYGEYVAYQRLTPVISGPNNTLGIKEIDVSSLNFTFPYTGVYFIAIRVPGSWTGSFQAASSMLLGSTANALYITKAASFVSQTQVMYRQGRYTTLSALPATMSNTPDENSSSQPFITLKTIP